MSRIDRTRTQVNEPGQGSGEAAFAITPLSRADRAAQGRRRTPAPRRQGAEDIDRYCLISSVESSSGS